MTGYERRVEDGVLGLALEQETGCGGKRGGVAHGGGDGTHASGTPARTGQGEWRSEESRGGHGHGHDHDSGDGQ